MHEMTVAAFYIDSLDNEGHAVLPSWLDRAASPISDVHRLVRRMLAGDVFTFCHCRRVAGLCLRMAGSLSLSGRMRTLLYVSSFFHDVGKLAIDPRLIARQGPVTEEELLIIRSHSIHGWQLLRDIPGFTEAARIVRHHHERMDGSGYPDRLCGDAIPYLSRIITVADSFDAMSSRPHSSRQTREAILKEIKDNTGRQFDMEIAESFVDTF